MHFRENKFWHQHSVTHEDCFHGSSWLKISTDSDNGLSPVRHKAITWTNVYLLTNICVCRPQYVKLHNNSLLVHVLLPAYITKPSSVQFDHYIDVIMTTVASQITSFTIVYSIVYSDADHRKHQSSASLAFVRGIHRGPVNSPHKWPVTRKMFPFDDVIMIQFISKIFCCCLFTWKWHKAHYTIKLRNTSSVFKDIYMNHQCTNS